MAVGMWRKIKVGIAEETTFNTYVTPTNWIPVQDSSFKKSIALLNAENIIGTHYDRTEQFAQGIKNWEGTLKGIVPLDDVGFLILLKQTFGKITTTLLGTTAYSHVFEVNESLFEGLSFTQHRDLNMVKASGGKVKTLKLSCGVNTFLEFEAGLIGGTYEEDALTGTPSFTFADTPFWVFDKGTITIGGTTYEIQGMDMTFENTFAEAEDQSYKCGSADRQRLVMTKQSLSGSLKRLWKVDGTNKSKFVEDFENLSDSLVVITFTGGEIETGHDYTFKIETNIVITGEPEIGNTGDIIQETINFQAVDDGTNPIAKITIYDSNSTPTSATGSYAG